MEASNIVVSETRQGKVISNECIEEVNHVDYV